MPISTKELKACTILNHQISRSGGQSYERKNEETTFDEEGKEVKTWDTKKTTVDKEEFDKGLSIQGAAKRALNGMGVHSPMGVIVNREKREEAEKLAEEWDAKIAEYNEEKVIDRMFNLLGDLSEALDSYNPENIRRILKKVSGYSEILPQAAAEAFDAAVENARKKASEISKYDKRAAKLAAKIEEEVSGKEATDVVAEAQKDMEEALASKSYLERRKAPELEKRILKLNKLMEDKEDALEKLEEAKATINKSSIERARFAVMKKRGSDDTPLDNGAAKLQGAQQGARFARMNRNKGKQAAANDA
jgi:hypothetical protein